MHLRYTTENTLLAMQQYRNWPEVVTLISKRQNFYKVVLKNGMCIESPRGLKSLMHDIFFRKVYTPSPLRIGRDDIVVDIGAHHGVFTLFAATQTRNSIYAFEASPLNFKILAQNLAANKLKHVVAFNSAVSDKVGATSFLLNPYVEQGNVQAAHLIPEKLKQFRNKPEHPVFDDLVPDPDNLDIYTEIEVPTTCLQAIIDDNNLGGIDFLKLDCEGSEGSILASTSPAYLRRIRKIALEFHDHLSQFTHVDIQKLLEEGSFVTRLSWDQQSPLGYIYAWRQ